MGDAMIDSVPAKDSLEKWATKVKISSTNKFKRVIQAFSGQAGYEHVKMLKAPIMDWAFEAPSSEKKWSSASGGVIYTGGVGYGYTWHATGLGLTLARTGLSERDDTEEFGYYPRSPFLKDGFDPDVFQVRVKLA